MQNEYAKILTASTLLNSREKKEIAHPFVLVVADTRVNVLVKIAEGVTIAYSEDSILKDPKPDVPFTETSKKGLKPSNAKA